MKPQWASADCKRLHAGQLSTYCFYWSFLITAAPAGSNACAAHGDPRTGFPVNAIKHSDSTDRSQAAHYPPYCDKEFLKEKKSGSRQF